MKPLALVQARKGKRFRVKKENEASKNDIELVSEIVKINQENFTQRAESSKRMNEGLSDYCDQDVEGLDRNDRLPQKSPSNGLVSSPLGTDFELDL